MKTSNTLLIIVLFLVAITLPSPAITQANLKGKTTSKTPCKVLESECKLNIDCCSNYCETFRSGRGNKCKTLPISKKK
jgi:hypothetical protein